MKFSSLMLAHWSVYKAIVKDFEAGHIPAHEFLEAHARWNTQVEAFEHQCSAESNYGAY